VAVDQKSNPVTMSRGNRIMDAAAELILRWGYQRVTVEDVAKRAAIGKGTIYLHWRSRDELFHATLRREVVGVFRTVVGRMSVDPVGCLPHRLIPGLFVECMRQPLLYALLTRDVETLGRLAAHSAGDSDAVDTVMDYREYLLLLREAGLVRADTTVDQQLYTLQVISSGASLVQPYLPAALDLPLRDKENTLAHAVRAALEPAGEPDRAALDVVAPRVIALLTNIADRYHDAIHRGPVPTTKE
jgi:AcrR family transcriptional regulator